MIARNASRVLFYLPGLLVLFELRWGIHPQFLFAHSGHTVADNTAPHLLNPGNKLLCRAIELPGYPIIFRKNIIYLTNRLEPFRRYILLSTPVPSITHTTTWVVWGIPFNLPSHPTRSEFVSNISFPHLLNILK